MTIWQFRFLARTSTENHSIFPPLHMTATEGQYEILPLVTVHYLKAMEVLERQFDRIVRCWYQQ
jgi:hypothetical protein